MTDGWGQALLFGLSLRHGWGVAASPENEARGFTWLQKAAETVIDDLDQAVQDCQLSGTEQEQAAQAVRVRSDACVGRLLMS
jgi:hypothetical protein